MMLFDLPVPQRVVNVASVPHRSPFRYPGGKTWLIPRIRQWLRALPRRPNVLVEPFAGGAIVGLTAAFEELARHVVLVELDSQVAAVWETILSDDAEWLIHRIASFELTLDNVRATLAKEVRSKREVAFRTILKNRTYHGGIMAAGASLIKNGENGKGIKSRWYPTTLARRISQIAAIRDRISFVHGDGLEYMRRYARRKRAAFFIDPPYTALGPHGKRAGTRLYTHHEIDHDRLFAAASRLAGEVLLTYDDAPEVRALAERHGFRVEPVAMKNTHHAVMSELLIGTAAESTQ